MKAIAAAVLCFLTHGAAAGQEHFNLWTRATFSSTIGPGLRLELEGQYRQQNLCRSARPEGFALLASIRPWLSYKRIPGWELSVSPLAYYAFHPVINTPGDEGKPTRHECRVSLAQLYQINARNDVAFVMRMAEEGRFFDDGSLFVRIRGKLGLRYKWSRQFSTLIFNELLVNLYGTRSGCGFDQNRTGIELRIALAEQLSLDAGYMRVARRQDGADPIESDNNAVVSISCSLNCLDARRR